MMSEKRKKNAAKRHRLPGDPSQDQMSERMIRVDHAGEFGAQRIYAGQLSVFKEGPMADTIRHMARQEDEHLLAFENLIKKRKLRPTALHPLWHIAGFALGLATAKLGEKAAMACTVAVEETIVEHYAEQLKHIGESDPALKKLIKKFQKDEDQHRKTGLRHGAEDLSYYPLLRALIRNGSKAAIWLSERL